MNFLLILLLLFLGFFRKVVGEKQQKSFEGELKYQIN